jgi:prefoldin subunit 5
MKRVCLFIALALLWAACADRQNNAATSRLPLEIATIDITDTTSVRILISALHEEINNLNARHNELAEEIRALRAAAPTSSGRNSDRSEIAALREELATLGSRVRNSQTDFDAFKLFKERMEKDKHYWGLHGYYSVEEAVVEIDKKIEELGKKGVQGDFTALKQFQDRMERDKSYSGGIGGYYNVEEAIGIIDRKLGEFNSFRSEVGNSNKRTDDRFREIMSNLGNLERKISTLESKLR